MSVIGRGELASQLAERTGLSNVDAARAIGALLECIAESLHAGDTVRLTGFGTFRVAETKERPGHDPRTGAPLTIPAGRRVLFSSSSRIKLSALVAGRASTPVTTRPAPHDSSGAPDVAGPTAKGSR
jgi:DNA-binding protein HU-beta